MGDTVIRGTLIFTSLLLLWQALVFIFHLPQYILPTPLEVLHIGYLRADILFHESLITISETLIGLLLGILFGMIAALCMAFFRPLSLWVLPILIISQALPTFAIAPLLVIWFGYGLASKIVTIIIMIFFPVASSFYDGLRRTDQGYLDLAKTMHALRWQEFIIIRIPSALPSLASGIRLATVAAPIGAIIGEWVGASRGLGYLMLNANARMEIDLMFAALFVIVIFSLLLYFIIDKILHQIIYW